MAATWVPPDEPDLYDVELVEPEIAILFVFILGG